MIYKYFNLRKYFPKINYGMNTAAEKKSKSKTVSKIIASSQNTFQIEIIENIGEDDSLVLYKISKQLVNIFGKNSLLNDNNIKKYFNNETLPFVARYKNNIIGYIIGVPIEYFIDEAWSHYDGNLNKKNTLYTYAFVMDVKYQSGKARYAKTLKSIYLSWAKKRGYEYVSGHVRQDLAIKFPNTKILKTFPVWYESKYPFSYYRRKL